MIWHKISQNYEKWILTGLLAISGIEAFVLTCYQFSSPSETQSAVLFGYSFYRIFLGVLLVGIGIVLLIASIKNYRSKSFYGKVISITTSIQGVIVFHVFIFIFLMSWLFLFWWNAELKSILIQYDSIYQRILPFLWWGLLVSGQAIFCLMIFRFGANNSTDKRRLSSPIALSKKEGVVRILLLVIALGIYTFMLTTGAPWKIAVKIRNEFFSLMVPLGILMWGAVSHRQRWGNELGLLIILPIFAITLLALWMTGASEDAILVGLYPLSDARSYYSDALNMINNYQHLEIYGGRPIFQTFLAFILLISGKNLLFSLAAITAINAACALFLAQEISRHTNSLSGIISLLLYFLFYRTFSGTFLTENLGLPIGALALTFLLRGIRNQSQVEKLWGIFIASLALNIRPASFFILPALVLWMFLENDKKAKKYWGSITAIILVLTGFVINSCLINQLSTSPNTPMFSRFPYTLYGIFSGGKNWGQILVDHPEVKTLSQDRAANQIYQYAFQAALKDPLTALKGMTIMLTDIFTLNNGVFTFLRGEDGNIILLPRFIMYILSAVGLFWCVQNRRKDLGLLYLLLVFGILLSAPAVPSRDSERMRTYASVMPIIFTLPALGLAWIGNGLNNFPIFEEHPDNWKSWNRIPAFALSFFFIGTLLSSIFWVKLGAQTPKIPQMTCQNNMKDIYLQVTPGSYVKLVSNQEHIPTHLPILVFSDYQHSINEFSYKYRYNKEPVKSGTYILNSVDLRTGEFILANVTGDNLENGSHIIQFCGQKKRGKNGSTGTAKQLFSTSTVSNLIMIFHQSIFQKKNALVKFYFYV
jgi:hypothetical protein